MFLWLIRAEERIFRSQFWEDDLKEKAKAGELLEARVGIELKAPLNFHKLLIPRMGRSE